MEEKLPAASDAMHVPWLLGASVWGINAVPFGSMAICAITRFEYSYLRLEVNIFKDIRVFQKHLV